MTFDDGYDDNYTVLYPLLEQYQAKATIFVIGNAMGSAHKMTREQVYELAASGLVSIQSHTYTHGNLSAMDEETLRLEMERSNAALAAATGQIPYVLCYPEGKYSHLTMEVAKDYYAFALRMDGWTYQTGMDRYQVPRSYISRRTAIYDSIGMSGRQEKPDNAERQKPRSVSPYMVKRREVCMPACGRNRTLPILILLFASDAGTRPRRASSAPRLRGRQARCLSGRASAAEWSGTEAAAQTSAGK